MKISSDNAPGKMQEASVIEDDLDFSGVGWSSSCIAEQGVNHLGGDGTSLLGDFTDGASTLRTLPMNIQDISKTTMATELPMRMTLRCPLHRILTTSSSVPNPDSWFPISGRLEMSKPIPMPPIVWASYLTRPESAGSSKTMMTPMKNFT